MTSKTRQPPAIILLKRGKAQDAVLSRLQQEFEVYALDRADPSLLTSSARETARGLAAFGAPLTTIIDALPQLEIIASFGVGYDSAIARHAASRNVVFTNTPDVLTEEVADTAIGLLINTVRELGRAENWLRAGLWPIEGAYPLSRLTLRGRRVGIYGLGRIGKAIAHRLDAFGLPVAYHNRRPVDGTSYQYFPNLMDLAAAVDTLISVVPGDVSTENGINADVLSALGPKGVFINIGRGSTVDEVALIDALNKGTIAAAGLDVFVDEPHVSQALLQAPNLTLLPHVGSASEQTRRAMADLVADNLVSWFSQGLPLTPVPEAQRR